MLLPAVAAWGTRRLVEGIVPRSAFFSSFSCRPPGSGRIIAEQLLSLTRIQTREPLPAPGLPIRLRI